MSDVEDVRKSIAEIKGIQSPEIPTSMPPTEPIQPLEDDSEQAQPNLPKGPAGY